MFSPPRIHSLLILLTCPLPLLSCSTMKDICGGDLCMYAPFDKNSLEGTCPVQMFTAYDRLIPSS
jgi:hypothetical protein